MLESAWLLLQEALRTVTPRQYAWGSWLLAIIIYCLSIKRIRPDLQWIIKLVISPKLLTAFAMMSAYIIGIVYALYQFGLWDSSLLFKTVMWFVFSGIIASFRAIEQARDIQYFKAVIKDSIKLAILLEFIVNKYTFSYFAELFMAPILVILSISFVILDKDEDFNNPAGVLLKKSLYAINVMINAVIVYYALSSALNDIDTLGSLGSIRKLLLSPILSILFIGFTYFFALWSAYEQVFIRLNCGTPKTTSLLNYIKFKTFLHCRLNLKKTDLFWRLNALQILNISDKHDAEILFNTLAQGNKN
jgi:hypothetical protein